jgi:uncharacterized protein YwgA
MAYLDALGLSKELGTFAGRKRVHKTVYLLKVLGADLRFGYSWYWHGPYSPELTRTVLNPPSEQTSPKRDLTKSELEIVNELRNFLGNDFYSVDTLELVVSLVYLMRHGPTQGYDTKSKIVGFVREKKPRYSTEQIELAWNKIEQSGIMRDQLTSMPE